MVLRGRPGVSRACRSCIYNVPIRTAVDVAPQTVARLRRDHDNIVGVKETTKDFEHFSRVFHAVRARHPDVVGHRAAVPAACWRSVASGFVSAVANLAPRRGRQHVRVAGSRATPRGPATSTTPCTRSSTSSSSKPTRRPSSSVLRRAGLIASAHVRPPLVTPTATGPRDRIDALLVGVLRARRTTRRPGRLAEAWLDDRVAGRRPNESSRLAAVQSFATTSTASACRQRRRRDHGSHSSRSATSTYCTDGRRRRRRIDEAVAAARQALVAGPRVGPAAPGAGPTPRTRSPTPSNPGARRALAEFESYDTGLPISQAHGQAARAAENFRFFADLIVDPRRRLSVSRPSSDTRSAGRKVSPA